MKLNNSLATELIIKVIKHTHDVSHHWMHNELRKENLPLCHILVKVVIHVGCICKNVSNRVKIREIINFFFNVLQAILIIYHNLNVQRDFDSLLQTTKNDFNWIFVLHLRVRRPTPPPPGPRVTGWIPSAPLNGKEKVSPSAKVLFTWPRLLAFDHTC